MNKTCQKCGQEFELFDKEEHEVAGYNLIVTCSEYRIEFSLCNECGNDVINPLLIEGEEKEEVAD